MLLLFLLIINSCAINFEKKSEISKAPYPSWAHSHWVWLSSDQANRTSEEAFVENFLKRDIPVGAVNLDSMWSTGVNNFSFDTKKYPDPKAMIAGFHSKGLRVIAWVTSMIDTTSSNFKYAEEKGYFLWGLDGINEVKWWHGVGRFLDYTNPEALAWWHKQMDVVIDMGLDGWKTDGTDPFVFELGVAIGHQGIVTEREYANLYYRDFLDYTRQRNPEALIMSRPVDSYDVLYWDFAPRDAVMASGWVGDQDPTFAGLQDALRNMLHSAWAGYVGFGSDTGGYRHGARSREVFLRWAGVNAFMSLFENGGDGNHGPWEFAPAEETIAIYRKFVHAHVELGPYLLAAGSKAYEDGGSMVHPLAEWTDLTPSTWEYVLGDDILVAPVTENGTRELPVTFPANADWVSYWNASQTYAGGSHAVVPAPLDEIPVFVKRGAMVPLHVSRPYVGHGDERSTGALTLFVPRPFSESSTISTIRGEVEDFSQQCHYTISRSTMILRCTPHSRDIILLVRGVAKVIQVQHEQAGVFPQVQDALNSTQPAWSINDGDLWVRGVSVNGKVSITITGIKVSDDA